MLLKTKLLVFDQHLYLSQVSLIDTYYLIVGQCTIIYLLFIVWLLVILNTHQYINVKNVNTNISIISHKICMYIYIYIYVVKPNKSL